MGKIVGIPKGLLYYDFYPMWKTFFEVLGAKVITSQNTNKKIVDDGVKNSVEDACLPVKTYVGHVMDLKERRVDYIFIPRIVSVEKKKYLCSKFLGLPDFIKSLIKDLPPVIDIEVNYYKDEEFTKREFIRAGKMFGRTKGDALKAYLKGMEEQRRFENLLKEGFTNLEALKMWEEGKVKVREERRRFDLKIALLSHPYNIMDEYISMELIGKLRNMGAEVITVEMLNKASILEGVAFLPKDIFWTYERDILGAGMYFLKKKGVDGVIMVSAFGCGPNSMTEELLERFYKREKNLPFMLLTIDEHTGEAGVMTRIEAFVDLLRFNKKAVVV